MSLSLKSKIEGLLYVAADEGLTIEQLGQLLEVDRAAIEQALSEIKQFHEQSDSALMLVNYASKYHFTTKPEYYEVIAKYLNLNKVRQLSQSALETLAIIAYKQPITRVEIEEIRGVSSELTIRKLVALDLIEEAGRLDTPGRPILYRVTDIFLEMFKLVSLDELPAIQIQKDVQEELF